MKIQIQIMIVALAVIAAAGCRPEASNAPAPQSSAPTALFTGKIAVGYTEAGQRFGKEGEIKQGMLIDLKIPSRMGGAEVNGTTWEFFVGNYQFKPVANLDRQPKNDGEVAVKIEIVTEKGQPVKPGNYPAAVPKDGANIVGKTRSVYMTVVENGKPKSLGITADYPRGERKGFVRIDSVEGGMVKGEIDIADDAYSVKGTFSAQISSN